MLSLKPELVGDERPCEGIPNYIPKGWSLEGDAPVAWFTKDISNSGVIGDSRGASEAIGANLHKVRLQESPNNAAEVYVESPQLEMIPETLETMATA